jgi:D-alanyl-lipoteichoic acid acyltransferase DltB (MBOAT superfamily)
LHIPANIGVIRILIPVGISFYTFRNISHLVDCYKKELAVHSFLDYANYVAFFPQIMSGPIVRAKEFYTFLHNPTLLSYSQGRIITLILSGLIKKYVIASYLYTVVSGPLASPTNYAPKDLILAAIAYSIMIYVDFSGYSDIAIAISNLLGFDVQPNFNSPYAAIGLKDFWNRWHISLSTWLKDYVYIPLGGNRSFRVIFFWKTWKIETKYAKYVNIMITMLVSGLWHGAGINFIVWGLLHGIGSVVTHIVSDLSKKFHKKDELENPVYQKYAADDKALKSALSHNTKRLVVQMHERDISKNVFQWILSLVVKTFAWGLTFAYVTFAWIFFSASSIQGALNFISAMFDSTVTVSKIFNIRIAIVIVVVLIFNFIGAKAFRLTIKFFDDIPLFIRIPFIAIVLYFILQLGPETVAPFIYFNF